MCDGVHARPARVSVRRCQAEPGQGEAADRQPSGNFRRADDHDGAGAVGASERGGRASAGASRRRPGAGRPRARSELGAPPSIRGLEPRRSAVRAEPVPVDRARPPRRAPRPLPRRPRRCGETGQDLDLGERAGRLAQVDQGARRTGRASGWPMASSTSARDPGGHATRVRAGRRGGRAGRCARARRRGRDRRPRPQHCLDRRAQHVEVELVDRREQHLALGEAVVGRARGRPRAGAGSPGAAGSTPPSRGSRSPGPALARARRGGARRPAGRARRGWRRGCSASRSGATGRRGAARSPAPRPRTGADASSVAAPRRRPCRGRPSAMLAPRSSPTRR